MTIAERYPETLRSLGTDLACSGLTAADVVRIEHVRPGSRRIVVHTRDGRARRAYALDGEGSCGIDVIADDIRAQLDRAADHA